MEDVVGNVRADNLESVRSELDGLAAVLESHFRWEERRIKDALNSFDVPGLTSGDMFGVTTTAATEDPTR